MKQTSQIDVFNFLLKQLHFSSFQIEFKENYVFNSTIYIILVHTLYIYVVYLFVLSTDEEQLLEPEENLHVF